MCGFTESDLTCVNAHWYLAFCSVLEPCNEVVQLKALFAVITQTAITNSAILFLYSLSCIVSAQLLLKHLSCNTIVYLRDFLKEISSPAMFGRFISVMGK